MVEGWWLKVGGWRLVVEGWWLKVGGWRLVVGGCLFTCCVCMYVCMYERKLHSMSPFYSHKPN